MANATDPYALHKYGTDPQKLIPKITRHSILRSRFWNETCFGLTLADIVPFSISLNCIAGTHATNRVPSQFLCLLLKLLQLAPDTNQISVYLHQSHFKYSRVLAAMYVRLTHRPIQIYTLLEPLLADCRQIAIRKNSGIHQQFQSTQSTNNSDFFITYVDVFIDALLQNNEIIGIILPRLPARHILEETSQLQPRISPTNPLT